MRPWLARALSQIRCHAVSRQVRFTWKARRELAELRLDELDACDVLASLRAVHSAGRLLSSETGEWLYLFKPTVAGAVLYLKVAMRRDCIVISFHEDEEADDP